jgi:hypothetical protein
VLELFVSAFYLTRYGRRVMKNKLQTTTLMLGILSFSQVQAVTIADIQEKAELKFSIAQNYTNPEADIPDELRTVWKISKDDGAVIKEVNGLGVNVTQVYLDTNTNKKYVILGDRFGIGMLKVGIGGAIEADDHTMKAGFEREKQEEHFGQLPPVNSEYHELGDQKTIIAGGICKNEDTYASKGWGPNIGWVVTENGYVLADLETAVTKMNDNAKLHFPVASFFGMKASDFNDKSSEERSATAAELLSNFNAALEDHIVSLHPKVKAYLEALSSDGNAILPEGYADAAEFSRQLVHDYTEYKAFYLVDLDDFFTMIDQNSDNSAAVKAKEEGIERGVNWSSFGLPNKAMTLFGAEGKTHAFIKGVFQAAID